jgi:hypothetical protein
VKKRTIKYVHNGIAATAILDKSLTQRPISLPLSKRKYIQTNPILSMNAAKPEINASNMNCPVNVLKSI